jgi:hypothetical protein
VLEFERKSSHFNHLCQLFGVAEGDDLTGILGHLLHHKRELLLGEEALVDVLLGERREELAVLAIESRTIVLGGVLTNLFILGLILGVDTNESFDGPSGIGGELLPNKKDRVGFRVLHRETIVGSLLEKVKKLF